MMERLERIMEAGFATLADLQRETNERLEQTNARLDQTNARLDQHEKVLVKLVTEVQALGERFDHFLTGSHRDDHERLRARIERVEKHLGLDG